MRYISTNVINAIFDNDFTGSRTPTIFVIIGGFLLNNVINMSISREENALTQQITIELNNINPSDHTDPGYYTQQRDDLANGKTKNEFYHIIQPGKNIIIQVGYGQNVDSVFNGEILTVETIFNGNDCTLEIVGRDDGMLLTRGEINSYYTITSKKLWEITYPIEPGILSTNFYLTSADEDPYLHHIFVDVCLRAGFYYSQILWDDFTLRIGDLDNEYFEEITGKWDSLIHTIARLLNARVFVNESNQIELRKKVDKPFTFDGQITLTGTTWLSLNINETNKDRAIEDSIVFDSGYEKDVDWEFDLETNMIRRTSASTIPSGSAVNVTYNYVNWIFKNGLNLYSLRQKNTHEDVYNLAVATNNNYDLQSELEIGALGDDSSIPANIIYREDLPELVTQTQLDDWVADKRVEIRRQYWGASASIVAVPQLQINDLVQFIIYGVISGIYKIIGFSLSYNPENGFDMQIETTFYANYNDDDGL
jgi:hypothetical protein